LNAADARKAIETPSPVDATQIERALAAMWKSAGADQGGVVTRACLWNVIARIEERADREGGAGATTLAGSLQELPQHLASRTLLLRSAEAQADKPSLESWISANCALGPGGHYVCSEEITILARGAGDHHLPSLVRALTVPDVPTAIVFAGVPRSDDRIAAELIACADRVVTDADRSALPKPLQRIRELVQKRPRGAMDLGWIALEPTRTRVADLFERLGGGAAASIRRVTAVAAARPSVRLLLGWISAALGKRDLSVSIVARQGEAESLRFDLDAGGSHAVPLGVEPASPTMWLARSLSGRGEDSSFLRALELSSEP
jgi:glucose-6-phosphate dehydrogenase assembly protein OpcA